MHVLKLDNLTPDSERGAAWERLVQNSAQSGVMQSLAWAEFKRARGLATLHLGLFDQETLIGGMILYIPRNVIQPSVLIAPDGAVLPWHDPSTAREGLRLLRDAAERYATQLNAIGIRIEPRVSPPKPAILRDWQRAPVDMLALQTLYLDLRLSEHELLAQMKPKGRYNIRLAQRHGVHVRRSTSHADLATFYQLLNDAGERDDFYVEPIDHFSDILNYLAPHGHAHLLFAEYEHEPLATMLLITYGHRAVYLYGGVSNVKRSMMAGYAIQWAAIQYAKSVGCSVYDFYGFEATGDPNHQYASFSRFKRNFGGTPVSFIGAHDFMWSERLADVVIRAIGELRT